MINDHLFVELQIYPWIQSASSFLFYTNVYYIHQNTLDLWEISKSQGVSFSYVYKVKSSKTSIYSKMQPGVERGYLKYLPQLAFEIHVTEKHSIKIK